MEGRRSLWAAAYFGWLPLVVVIQWFVVSGGSWFSNQLRTLAAHGYDNDGDPVDSDGQLLDSVNLRGWPLLTALVAPVGLRFHALHHHLPGLPYHSLGHVHRRLLGGDTQAAPPRSPRRGGPRGAIAGGSTILLQPAAHERVPTGVEVQRRGVPCPEGAKARKSARSSRPAGC